MTLLSDAERAFLTGHVIARLATTGRAGRPHVVPVAFTLDPASDALRIGQQPIEHRGQDRLYVRHVRANPGVAVVVDDVRTEPEFAPSGIVLKGDAVLHATGGERLNPGLGPQWIEVVPSWVSSWGIDTGPFAAAVPRRA